MLNRTIAAGCGLGLVGYSPVSDAGAITMDISSQISAPCSQSIEKQNAYSALMSELSEIYQETCYNGWDGGEELAFSKDLLFLSADFINSIVRLNLPLPEVYFEADGEIAFDWILSTEQILSISMNKYGRLAWLSLIKERKLEDTSQFSGLIPSKLAKEIELITEV